MQELDICGRKLVIHENDDTSDSATGRAMTGSWLWDSGAVHRANWMQTHVDRITGKTVVELGAGTGLPGITIYSSGLRR